MNKNTRILVTGSNGFLGREVVDELERQGYKDIIKANGKADCDFRNATSTSHLLKYYNPKVVIHLAATVGGIGANLENPGSFFFDNITMGVNLIESSRMNNVEKFVLVGTVCMYPNHTEVPFKEENLWNGYPEPTNAPYGIAKKALMEMLNAYRKQYGFNGITLLPVNLYGPHDNFHPNNSHVIAALINKFYAATRKAEHDDVTIWGTGEASREFLYVNDCAMGIIKGMECYNKPEPINLGTGEEIKIAELAEIIAACFNFNGKILFDYNKPNGQMRRCLDVTKAKTELGFTATMPFSGGLQETINSYMKEKDDRS